MTFEMGTWITLISTIVSVVITVVYDVYKVRKEAKRKRKMQQLDILYCPILKIIYKDFYTNSYDEGYLGLDEERLIRIIQIIHDNISLADSALWKWREDFEEQLYNTIYYIRPHNEEYSQLYDEDKRFFEFIKKRIEELRKDTYIE